MIKQGIGFILIATLLGVEPAPAPAAGLGSAGPGPDFGGTSGKYPGQSQRSINSGYCPGVLRHVYHLSDCRHAYKEYYQAHPELRPK